MLGHQIPFAYCRQPGSSQPCRKILDCWFEIFDILAYAKEHFPPEQLQSIGAPPKPKMTTLIELIQQAQHAANTNSGQ